MIAWEGAHAHGDARKLLVSRLVQEHRVEASDPLSPPDGGWEQSAYSVLFDDGPAMALAGVNELLVAC